MKFSKILLMLFLATFSFATACKDKDEDPETPPTIEFKTGSGYTSADATVAKNTTLKVGIKATKTEDDLKTYTVSYAYDGATSTSSFQNINITADLFESDVNITTRNQSGTEKWYFTITDSDGNIAQKILTLTVN